MKVTFAINPGMMDGWVRVLHPFNSISVISKRWKGEHERLCEMKRHLGSGRISPPAGFEPVTPWSEVGSANRSATRTLQSSNESETAQMCYNTSIGSFSWPDQIAEVSLLGIVWLVKHSEEIYVKQDRRLPLELPCTFWTLIMTNQFMP